MSEGDTSHGTGGSDESSEFGGSNEFGESGQFGGDEYEPTQQYGAAPGEGGSSVAGRLVRRGVETGVLPGVAGAVLAVRGVRRFREGARLRGVLQTSLGGVLVGLGAARARASFGPGEPGPVPEPGAEPAVGETDFEFGGSAVSTGDEESGADATGTADTSTDAGTTGQVTDAGSATAAADYDRLGAAAFDDDSNELPAPQAAFDREFLVLDGEVFWGVREADDAVVASQLYDPIEDAEGMRYVASSQVDDDRTVSVPSTVLDHWDDVAGGGVALTSGDDLVFATADDLAEERLLVVVPAEWVDDVLGNEK